MSFKQLSGVDPVTEALTGVLTRYASAVGLGVLLYDYVLTIKVEVSCDCIF